MTMKAFELEVDGAAIRGQQWHGNSFDLLSNAALESHNIHVNDLVGTAGALLTWAREWRDVGWVPTADFSCTYDDAYLPDVSHTTGRLPGQGNDDRRFLQAYATNSTRLLGNIVSSTNAVPSDPWHLNFLPLGEANATVYNFASPHIPYDLFRTVITKFTIECSISVSMQTSVYFLLYVKLLTPPSTVASPSV